MAADEARAVTRGTLALGLGSAAIACLVALVFDPALARAIALGALFGLANFLLLARAIDRATRNAVSAAAHDRTPERPLFALGVLVRLPLLVVALALVLWYLPTRPEGLIVGFGLVLVALALAAVNARRTSQIR